MKKLIFTILFLSFGALALVQAQSGPASCPIITNFELHQMTADGTGDLGQVFAGDPGPFTGKWKVFFDYQNATSGNKWVKVVISCDGNPVVITSSTGGAICFDVPKDQTITSPFATSVFTCPNLTTLIVTVESWVGNNCGGTLCNRQLSIGGSPLPVAFKSFAAIRNNSNVMLKWETGFEQNNTGFAIERNIRGTWEQIAFVPTQAAGGNSDGELSYQFTDQNNVKGMSQYRIQQIDYDSKTKYSDIRAVRGEGQIGKTIVYPNPSNNGKVSVVFEDATVTRTVSLMDMSGRIVKSWKNVTNNNIQIDNLTPGMYSLRIVVPETGDQSVEKIIVSKR